MKMIITFGKKEIVLVPSKSGKWDIETRASLRTSGIKEKLDLVSWRIIKPRLNKEQKGGKLI